MDKQGRKRNNSEQHASVCGGQHEASKRFKTNGNRVHYPVKEEEAKRSTATNDAQGPPETEGGEEVEFDEALYKEEKEDDYSVGSDEGDYAAASGVMRLEEDFDEAKDVRHPIWLMIARFMDRDGLELLEESVPQLKGYSLLVRAERRTVEQLENIERCGKRGKKNCDLDPLLQLDTSEAFRSPGDPRREFWYSWCAEGARFLNTQQFEKFCEFAGVDPTKGVELSLDVWYSPTYHFMSNDRKVIFSCSDDPRTENGYGGYIGVTGERSRVKWLSQWFDDIVSWDVMSHGTREDHDVYTLTLNLSRFE